MQVTESIWNEYHNKLHRFIQGRVSDASIADDILQEVIIRVHSRINTLKDSNKIQNWLYRIARNAIIDHTERGRFKTRVVFIGCKGKGSARPGDDEGDAVKVLPFRVRSSRKDDRL